MYLLSYVFYHLCEYFQADEAHKSHGMWGIKERYHQQDLCSEVLVTLIKNSCAGWKVIKWTIIILLSSYIATRSLLRSPAETNLHRLTSYALMKRPFSRDARGIWYLAFKTALCFLICCSARILFKLLIGWGKTRALIISQLIGPFVLCCMK